MGYAHTQRAPLHTIILGVAVLLLALALRSGERSAATVVAGVAAVVILVLAFSFRTLTVTDEGERLAIRFGPLPLFRTSIPYAHITSVEPGRSSLLDGWGIHYLPGRGWIWNLWGFDCAVMRVGPRVVRVGTDDLDDLIAFLRERIVDTEA